MARERIRSPVCKSELISELTTEFLRRGERLLQGAALLPNREFYGRCFCEDSEGVSDLGNSSGKLPMREAVPGPSAHPQFASPWAGIVI
jgi:hypothetical protein